MDNNISIDIHVKYVDCRCAYYGYEISYPRQHCLNLVNGAITCIAINNNE